MELHEKLQAWRERGDKCIHGTGRGVLIFLATLVRHASATAKFRGMAMAKRNDNPGGNLAGRVQLRENFVRRNLFRITKRGSANSIGRKARLAV